VVLPKSASRPKEKRVMVSSAKTGQPHVCEKRGACLLQPALARKKEERGSIQSGVFA